MIIDFHTHSFPEQLAPKAICTLKNNIKTEPHTDGTIAGLHASMKSAGISSSVVCNISTNPRQQTKVNGFAVDSLQEDGIIPLGSVHPDSENIEEVLLSLRQCGIKGIKVHPDFMGYDITDPKFNRIFDVCSSFGLFVVTHAGVDALSPDHVHATPKMISEVITRFPSLKLVAAHFGGNMMWDEVESELCGKNVYFDTSLPDADTFDVTEIERVIGKHDPDKLLFGTDSPWCSQKLHVRFIEGLDISDDVKEKIFSLNALRLLS